MICPFSSRDVETIKKNLFKNIVVSSQAATKITKNDVVLEAIPGAVIAAPTLMNNTFGPNYYFHWVRDGAIVMQEIAYLYENAKNLNEKNALKEMLLNYLNFVNKIQSQPPVNKVDILGEPKFNIDGTLWTGQWARPQNDGVAYQAIVLTHIANILLNEGQDDFVKQHIYNPHNMVGLLKSNLEYTAFHWSEKTTGSWEELYGFHFSVQMLQRFALTEGAMLAKRLNDLKAADYYLAQVAHISDFLNQYWNPCIGYICETVKERDLRGGGINMLSIISLVYGRHDEINIQDPFRITSEACLSTAFYIRYLFEGLYQINVINKDKKIGGSLMGRYPNDVYDGNKSFYGNPWFLCTNLMAAFYYLVAEELLAGAKIKVTFLVKQFLNQLDVDLNVSTSTVIDNQAACFKPLLIALIQAGDTILKAVKHSCVQYEDGSDLHMSEQIDRATGNQCSAPDLSWSYTALLTALRARTRTLSLLER